MAHRMARSVLSGIVISLPALLSPLAWAQEQPAAPAPAWIMPPAWFVYTIIFVVLGGSLLALLFIRAAVGNSSWSLADALSEEAEVTAMVTNAQGQTVAQLDASDKPVLVTEMRASSSRLIALMGMMGILLMFLGFGTFALYSFALTGRMPADINKAISFLVAGLTLFAPYVVNKFSSMFESLSPPRG
jgi:hypothetical protein